MDKFKSKFIEEASDNINDLEDALLALDKDPDNSEIIERVFRAMHSLKGGGAMFGFSNLSDFTHHLENIYDLVREGELKVTKELLDLTLASVDHLKLLLTDNELSSPKAQNQHNNLMVQVSKFAKDGYTPVKDNHEGNNVPDSNVKSYYIFFEPEPELFNDGTNPLFLLDELQSLGEVRVFAHLNKVPLFDKLEETRCYTYWEAILVTDEDVNSITDVFIFVEDQCKLEVHEIADGNILQKESFTQQIDVVAQTEQDIGISRVQSIVKSAKVEKKKEVVHKKAFVPQTKGGNGKENTISSIRVSSAKLDQLMNLVSELVTTQARLSLYAEESGQPELVVIGENVQKLSRQLRDNAFDIVLVPIETMLTRFQRLVRDLSKDMDKDIEFTAEGTDTELDKTIIETLTDPLLHILRNSIDHGIESAEQRKKLGKPAKGKIVMKAFYSGANVHIQLHDDGAGINVDQIREKAISKGIINKDINLSKKEILDLVFLPGFTTATNVTDVSGRGVGMDVVKRKLSEIRGEVELDSEVNVGTTLTIKLPLTLSIIDGLLVQIINDRYVIPLSVVDKIYAIEHEKVVNIFNSLVILDGEQIPFYYLREEFNLPESDQSIEQIVVVKYEEKRIGIVVDSVVGEYQAVLKSLGKMYKEQEIISGATILGDGTVALVMDTNKLIGKFSNDLFNINTEENNN